MLSFLAELQGQRCQAALLSTDLMPWDKDMASCPRARQEGLNRSCSKMKSESQGDPHDPKVVETTKPVGRAELRLWPSLMCGGLSQGIELPAFEGLNGRKMWKML